MLFTAARRGAAATALAASIVSGCSSPDRRAAGDQLLRFPVPDHVVVEVGPAAGLGPVLTDADGRTLYLFPPDAARAVTCTGACAGTWPPLVIASGQQPTAGPGVRAALLGTVTDPNTGARAVTYAGRPLYRYAGDVRAGTANGQALFSDGGPWYALSPSGVPVTRAVTP